MPGEYCDLPPDAWPAPPLCWYCSSLGTAFFASTCLPSIVCVSKAKRKSIGAGKFRQINERAPGTNEGNCRRGHLKTRMGQEMAHNSPLCTRGSHPEELLEGARTLGHLLRRCGICKHDEAETPWLSGAPVEHDAHFSHLPEIPKVRPQRFCSQPCHTSVPQLRANVVVSRDTLEGTAARRRPCTRNWGAEVGC